MNPQEALRHFIALRPLHSLRHGTNACELETIPQTARGFGPFFIGLVDVGQRTVIFVVLENGEYSSATVWNGAESLAKIRARVSDFDGFCPRCHSVHRLGEAMIGNRVYFDCPDCKYHEEDEIS